MDRPVEGVATTDAGADVAVDTAWPDATAEVPAMDGLPPDVASSDAGADVPAMDGLPPDVASSDAGAEVRAMDGLPPDVASFDAGAEVRDGGGEPVCVPGCHWDCFGSGPRCAEGSVWAFGYGPRPCCQYAEPWPGPGPVCSLDTPLYRCTAGCAPAPIDERYAECFDRRDAGGPRLPDSILKLACAEGKGRVAGDPCVVDGDCRPAAADGLRCDLATGRCAVVARPAAPAAYGKSCGLTAEALPGYALATYPERLVEGKTCALCLVSRTSTGETCLRQGCTMPCQYDEDCPEGSVCLCSRQPFQTGATMALYCAPITNRTSDVARTAWLSCP